MVANPNDDIEFTFVPEQKYEDYGFAVTYTLPNNNVVEVNKGKKYTYNYTVPNDIVGQTTVINVKAIYEKNDDDNNISISAFGGFKLRVNP